MRFRISICSLVLLGLGASLVQAGSMAMMLSADKRFDPVTFAELPILTDPVTGAVLNGQAGLYQMGVRFTATKDPATEKGWLNTLFSAMAMGAPGLTLSAGSYAANTGTVDINGGLPGGVTAVYGTNQDAGADGTDLQNIIASLSGANITTSANDTRNHLGTAQAPPSVGFPTHIGDFLVNWDGLGIGQVVLKDHEFSFSLLSNTPGQAQQGAGASAAFGGGPPDLFLVDDGLADQGGYLPGQLVTGGPLPTNDSDDPDSLVWLLESLTGPGGAVVGATVDPLTGRFSWQSEASSPLGAYAALIRGTNANDPIGTDTGTMRFNLVPEPASLTLLGLAMFGAIGFIRRR